MRDKHWVNTGRVQWAIRGRVTGQILTDAEQNPETPGMMLWNTRKAARACLCDGEQVVRVEVRITSERG